MTYLEQKYERNRVILGLRNNFLPDYRESETIIRYTNDLILQVTKLGICDELQLPIYEIKHSSNDARVSLTKEALKIIKGDAFTGQALFLFVPQNSSQYRISLVTYDWIGKECSNPRRFSFLVGEDSKTHTATKQLTGKVHTREDLLKRFSIEVVNKEFYERIEECFEDLLKTIKYDKAANNFKMRQEFVVRLIGRLIFCWFLKKKAKKDGSQLIPEELLSLNAVKQRKDDYLYYPEILEPLFFETLNRKPIDRNETTKKGFYKDIPFLNGGLFEPHNDDCYNYATQQGQIGTLQIKNNWFIKLFSIFEEYNFTIDENTPTDIELSVDPEMLGRIFENLLGAINPETQKSARKATGSYYTPREIVDYMVTQSLKQFLYTKTDIDHKKIDSLFKLEHTLETEEEKQKIYNALSSIKILDPAVGSGAFPMGVLQKMMSITKLLYPHITVSKKQDYQNKLKFIQKCIYGIDIQTMAIEICRLRFFLTLIVDEESDNIEPLPNLEFNFVCANSLIPLDNNNLLELKQQIASLNEQINQKKNQPLLKERNIWNFSEDQKNHIKLIKKELDKLEREKNNIQKQLNQANIINFLDGDNYIAQLRAHREDFFNSSGAKKEEFKQQFIDTQKAMLEALKANDWGNDKVTKLQNWEPFKNSSTAWFDPFWMFGVEDGFDIVIANPPYVVYGLNKELLDSYKNNSNAYQKNLGKGNRQTNLFCFMLEKGLELINREGIISFIIPHSFIRVKGYEYMRRYIFENKRIPYHIVDEKDAFDNVTLEMISIFITNRDIAPELSFLSRRDGIIRKEPLDYFIKTSKPYIYWDKITEKLLKYPSHKLNGFRGLPKETIGNIILLGGKSTKRYYIDNRNLSYTNTNEMNEFFVKDKALDNEEIVITQFGVPYPRGTIINTKEFCPSGGNVVVKHNTNLNKKFVLGILQSKLIKYFFSRNILNCATLTIHLDGTYLEEIPIPNVLDKEQAPVISLVDTILDIKKKNNEVNTKEYEDEIDKLVYQLYGLTAEEIKIVEESQPKDKNGR